MRRILVVDDDRHTRLAIGIWLKQCGFRVAITDGGESGLAALNDGTFDLMIVDVFMPTSVPPNISRERESKYGLNCQGEAMRRSPLSLTLTWWRKPPAPPTKPDGP